MRRFHLLMLSLLTVIAVELGLLIVQHPAPTVQAGPSTTTAPTPGLQDPHDILRAQLDRLEKGLAEVQRELATNRQQTTALTQKMEKDHADVAQQVTTIGGQTKKLLNYGDTWAWTCIWAGNLFGDLDPQRQKSIRPPDHDVCVHLR